MRVVSDSRRVSRAVTWAALAMMVAAFIAVAGRPAAPAYAAASTFKFSASTYNVTEGQTAELIVQRTSGSGALNVPFIIEHIDTTSTDIFGLISGAVSFGASDTQKTLLIPIFDDGDFEGGEDFKVKLQDASDVTIVDPKEATVTIADNDGPASFAFSSATYETVEKNGTVTITVVRSGTTSGAATVEYFTEDGTATAPDDYVAITATTLSFSDGQSSKTFTVTIKQDSIVEGDHSLTLKLQNPSVGSIGTPHPATLTIKDDENGVIEFTSSAYSVTEGDTASVTLKRTGGSVGEVSVVCKTVSGGSASGSDYTTTSQTITWANGDSANKTCSIPTTEDTTPESSETVNLKIDTPTGGALIGTQDTAVLTILDDDAASTVQFSAASYSVNEGAGTATITVTRSGSTSVQATVNYATSNGTATGGVDFTHTSGTLTFPIGSTSQTFTVTVIEDTSEEPNETINLTLSSPVSVTLGTPSTSVLTILDNDGADPTVSTVSPTSGPVAGGTSVVITGTNFTNVTSVKFGSTEADSFTVNSSTQITAVTPTHTAGPVGVIVTTTAGTSNTDITFTFVGTAPTVTNVSPSSGPTAGGTTVTVTGTNFLGATSLTIGGTSVTFTINSSTKITFTTPAKSTGTVDIRVTSPAGTSPNTSADDFTYTDVQQTITYTLTFRWTLLVWNGIDNILAKNVLQGLESPDNPTTNNVYFIVTAIFTWNAPGQAWLAYFPQADRDNLPGVNDFTTLKRGTAYWFAANVTTDWTVVEGQ